MYTKGQILYLVVFPRTRPRTFLNCFVLDLSVFKAKQLRILLGRGLGQKKLDTKPHF